MQRLAGHRIPGMTESYLHLWESRLREAVTVLEKFTIEKLQAAMNDERGIVQPTKWATGPSTGSCEQFVGS